MEPILSDEIIQVFNNIEELEEEQEEIEGRVREIKLNIPGKKTCKIPFPFQYLPNFLKNLVQLISPTTLAPNEFIATSLITSMSSCIGTRAYIQLGRRVYYPVIWSMLIAPSSESFKSTALWEGRKFINSIDVEYQKEYQFEYSNYEQELEQWNSTEKGVRGPKPFPPIRREIDFSDDETLESFYSTLCNNPDGGLISHDEIGAWLLGFDKYTSAKSEKKRWLTIFENRPVKYKRKMNDTHLDIPKPFVSLCGGITNNTFSNIFRNTESEIESGFLPRFIFCYKPVLTKLDYSFFKPDIDQNKWDDAYQIFKRVTELQSGAVAPSQQGIEMLDDWYIQHEKERHNPHFPDELRPFWRRLEGYLLKFALIFHQFKRVTGEVNSNVISPETITEAIAITNYYKGQAERVVSELFKTQEDKYQDVIVEFLKKVGGKATVREIQRAKQSLRDIPNLIKTMAGNDIVTIATENNTRGRKSIIVTLKEYDNMTKSKTP